MNVRFAGFDVVVKVVSESLDVRDDGLAALRSEVTWEEYYIKTFVNIEVLDEARE